MWIRAQYGMAAADVKNISIRKMNNKFVVQSFYEGGVSIYGEYSTKEKAFKVMDMIEDAILKCEAMRTGYAEYDFGAFVFDMPDDKDVEV